MLDQSIELTLEAQVPQPVITKAEAEYALDRKTFDRLFQKWGADTLWTWMWQTRLQLPREPVQATPESMAAVRRG